MEHETWSKYTQENQVVLMFNTWIMTNFDFGIGEGRSRYIF